MSVVLSERIRTLLLGSLGVGIFLGLWEVVGRLRLLGLSWPPLTEVLALLGTPARWSLFARALAASLEALTVGYLIGLISGIIAAALAHLTPSLKLGLDRTSAVIHAIPSIALAPLFILFLGRNATPAALAALSVFFVSYVATSSGLGSVPRPLQDLVHVLGGTRLTQFVRLDLPAALPVLASGMRLAAPAALIGVIVGEWFGAPRGLGVLVINAMQNFQIPLLWSAVLLAVLVSLTLFGLLGLLQHYVARRFR